MRQIVSDDAIQAAFDYLNEQGGAAAQAKADLIIAEFRRKKVRAQLILKSEEKTMGLREAEADCHPDYWDACQAEAAAVKEVGWHQHQRARADAICSAWQTQESSRRALGRVVASVTPA